MPLHMRLPKLRGFKNPFRVEYQVVNLDQLSASCSPRVATSPSTTWSPRAPSARASSSRCSATASSRSRCRSPRTRSPPPPRTRSRPPAAPPPSSDRASGVATAARCPGRRRAQPAIVGVLSSAARIGPSPRTSRRHRAGQRRRISCSPRSPGRSGRRTCARSCCSPWRIMAIFRLGSFIPTPGVDYRPSRPACPDRQQQRRCYGLVNLFSGGALLQLSVFALGIMPYITASIIVQLLTRGHPAVRGAQEGGPGRHGQAHAVHPLPDGRPGGPAVDRPSSPLARNPGALFQQLQRAEPRARTSRLVRSCIMIVTMTAGTGVIMWLGELDHRPRHRQRHVAADLHLDRRRFPSSLWAIQHSQGRWSTFVAGDRGRARASSALVVFVEQSQRRIPVQYAKRMVGRRMYGGTTTYIPIKVNMAGVIPVIFASSLLYIPALIAQFNRPATTPPRLGRRGSRRNFVARRPPALHAHLLRADHLLHATSTSRSRSTRTRSRTT